MADRNYRRRLQSGMQDAAYSTNAMGDYKGIVEDVEDPMGLGRVKVRIYSLNGDYKDLDTEGLMWIEPNFRTKGSFDPPELWDRVTISFENGDKDHPIMTGYWYSTPAGRGRLPHNLRRGSEVPPDYWTHHNLYPQTQGIARSSEGSSIWFEDTTHDTVYDSTINLQDSGGKYLKIMSRRKDDKDYTPEGNIGGNPGYDPWKPGKVHRLGDISGVRGDIHSPGEYAAGIGEWTHAVNSFDSGFTSMTEVVKPKIMGAGIAGVSIAHGNSQNIYANCENGHSIVSLVKEASVAASIKGVADISQSFFPPELWDGPGA